ncbi:MAG: hypothetical protein H6942_07105 [Candidatus Accumulibacter sp.]|uniref:hypothetical protein n=1 Tax=Accumulibacter sp. TaxID=2053492 RepID=UPI0019FADA65|nr:hypothetical protein [Accumulibacter sp.]MBE2259097.1 hypothetical protein [Paracoccaceae bacterium]MCP5248293.1 hypothetical protein [Accumulibacter sp.]
MKRRHGLSSRLRCLASRLLMLSLCLSGPLLPQWVQAQAATGFAHVSTGIGDDDPIELEALRHDYNLQLVFALKGSGAYLADVKVGIDNAAGERVLAALSPGPLFFVRLPPGQYRVAAEYRGIVLSRSVRLAADRRHDAYFYWQGE